METDVQFAPLLLDLLKNGLQRPLGLQIERHEDRSFKFLGKRLDEFFRLVIPISHGQVGAEGAKGLGAAIGDRLIVGDAGDQRFLALEQRQGGHIDHALFSLRWNAGCLRRTLSVWRAIMSSSSVGTT